ASPRKERFPPSARLANLRFSRHVDPDSVHPVDEEDDQLILQRYVAHGDVSLVSPRTPSLAQPSPKSDQIRQPACSMPPLHSNTTRTSVATWPSPRKPGPSILRPQSPVGDYPTEVVVTPQMYQLSPRFSPRRAILTSSDVDKITLWLQSLAHESRQYSSYFLYCEMLFRESGALIRGKPTPNRLQTAVAFHCLCKASSIFGRHEGILHKICSDLGAALFIKQGHLPISDDEVDVLEFYSKQVTFYENQNMLKQEKENLQAELVKQQYKLNDRARLEEAHLKQIQELEKRYKLTAIDGITSRGSNHDDLRDKLRAVLQYFQYIEDDEKQNVIVGVVDGLHAHLTAGTALTLIDDMATYEKDRLLRDLFQDEIHRITERIRSEVMVTTSAQQTAIVERSVSRITKFQTLITEVLKGHRAKSGASTASNSPPVSIDAADDDDLCDQDRKVLECVNDLMDELQREKKKNAEMQAKLHEAEQLAQNLRWKNNDQANESQEAAVKLHREVRELKEELAKHVRPTEDKQTQINRQSQHSGEEGCGNDDDYDDDESDEYASRRSGGGHSNSLARRGGGRRRGGQSDRDDDFAYRIKRGHKFGVGIASIIEQAKIPVSKVRKILSKRKPLTLSELHAIIVGYYQAKMFQDIQDDNTGKTRTNLAQFIMEMYILHYGLKDLAISQLVFLDAAVRKYAKESARVRVFGLLVGSLEPESHACSVQGIDFYLFIIVVIFNAGVFKRGRKQAVAIAQGLRTFFGEGIGPAVVRAKSDVVCQTIDLVFSFQRNENRDRMEELKDEIRIWCAQHAIIDGAIVTGVDIDIALEMIMSYWFNLYEEQVQDIHAMFGVVDTNGDGTLDFREFFELVTVLEPTMDRRDALTLYTRAAGDDQVIDKDEFVRVMLAHQRGVVLRELYGGGDHASRTKTPGTPNKRGTTPPSLSMAMSIPETPLGGASRGTIAVPGMAPGGASASPTPFQTPAMLSGEDNEGSYASLAAAINNMESTMEAFEAAVAAEEEAGEEVIQSLDAQVQQGDDGDIMRPRANGGDSVSFMTLSRLSIWASEAKDKLLNARKTKNATQPPPEPAVGVAAASTVPLMPFKKSASQSSPTPERDPPAPRQATPQQASSGSTDTQPLVPVTPPKPQHPPSTDALFRMATRKALFTPPEDTTTAFAADVDLLLQQALSKANIDLDGIE
ncbi:TPA: hypothetical protein N0F65_003326, partial [Lagenidium giganteum]